MRMTIEDAIETLKDTNTYGTADIAKGVAIDTMLKYQKVQKVLERIWNIPSHLIDKEQCLDRIMETYREVRVEDGNNNN